jgi:dTDP-4-dehydrorhamnose 3,5-epimerase
MTTDVSKVPVWRTRHQQKGLVGQLCQVNNSFSAKKRTLRGTLSVTAQAETKLIWCIRGALHDVVLDLRIDSTTFGQSFSAILTADNRRMTHVERTPAIDLT